MFFHSNHYVDSEMLGGADPNEVSAIVEAAPQAAAIVPAADADYFDFVKVERDNPALLVCSGAPEALGPPKKKVGLNPLMLESNAVQASRKKLTGRLARP